MVPTPLRVLPRARLKNNLAQHRRERREREQVPGKLILGKGTEESRYKLVLGLHITRLIRLHSLVLTTVVELCFSSV